MRVLELPQSIEMKKMRKRPEELVWKRPVLCALLYDCII
jgi:hypothetical protein